MTDERTHCTALERIDSRYAKKVSRCCQHHDDAYGRPRFPFRLTDDFKWGRCAWKKGEGQGHKAKTVVYTLLLMTFSWILYYDVDKAIYRRLPFLKRVKDWLG